MFKAQEWAAVREIAVGERDGSGPGSPQVPHLEKPAGLRDSGRDKLERNQPLDPMTQGQSLRPFRATNKQM